MLEGQSLSDYTNFFSPSDYEKNDKIIPKKFQEILKRLGWKKPIVLFVISMKNLKTLNIIHFRKKQ